MRTEFRLAGWIIRPQRACIERAGVVVHVKPKAMAVLERLAQNAGNVVTRDELFVSVWPGGVVTDDVLTQCIVELRKAFGDSARNAKVIQTIPKVGFLLVPAVKPLDNSDDVASVVDPLKTRARVSVIIVGSVLVALVLFWYLTGLRHTPPGPVVNETKSIAVLPFIDMSEAGDQAYFADGLTEELTNRLTQLSGLDVAARTSSFYFKDKNVDMQGIAKALGVNHLLEGSVRRDKDRLRITAQLIEAKEGFHLWSRQYDRSFDEIFTIQEEIATSVADSLSIKLQVGELATMPGGTSSVEAYEEVLLSKKDQWESTPESIVRAIGRLKRAIEIDPNYAMAWYRLAGVYLNANVLLGTEGLPGVYQKSEEALARALSLEPALPGARALTVMIQNKQRQWSEVEKTLNGGAGLEQSSNGELIKAYCGFLLRMGRIQEAIPLVERIRVLMPYSSIVARMLGTMYMIEERPQEGFAELERAFELEGFESWDVEFGLLATLSTDNRDELQKWLKRAQQYMTNSRPLIAAMTEHLDDHEAALDWLRNDYQQSETVNCMFTHWAAWHGDTGLAVDALGRCPAPMYFWHGVLQDVRRTEGFKDMIRQLGMEEYYREFGWNDFCQPLGSKDFACE